MGLGKPEDESVHDNAVVSAVVMRLDANEQKKTYELAPHASDSTLWPHEPFGAANGTHQTSSCAGPESLFWILLR